MKQFDSTRIVWDAITRDPNASTREIAEDTGLPHHAIQLAIYTLESAGYITRQPRQARARQVLLPFRIQEPQT